MPYVKLRYSDGWWDIADVLDPLDDRAGEGAPWHGYVHLEQPILDAWERHNAEAAVFQRLFRMLDDERTLEVTKR